MKSSVWEVYLVTYLNTNTPEWVVRTAEWVIKLGFLKLEGALVTGPQIRWVPISISQAKSINSLIKLTPI